MSGVVLGLDCGNTAIKAALFDAAGHEIVSAARAIETQFPEPNHTELNMARLWQLGCEVIGEVLAHPALSTTQISAIGVSGHGNGAYLLDKHHQPLLAIQSLDSRASERVANLQAEKHYSRIRTLNRQGAWSSQTATLLNWLKQNRASLYEDIGTVFFCKDYLNFCLTDEIKTDYSDLSASGLFDFTQHEVSTELLSFFDILEMASAIPAPCHSEHIIGHVTAQASELTGLPEGIPVVGGMLDVVASAMGSGVWDSNDASIVTGTWSINQVVTDTLPSEQLFMTCLFPQHRFLAMENSATSASNLEWFVREFFAHEKQQATSINQSVFEQCNQLIEQVELSSALPLFHPYLYGSGDNGAARGSFFDLAGWHTKPDLLYAVYEGIVFGHLEHVLKLNYAGIHFSHALLTGGGAKSAFWCQLFADVLNVEIHITQCSESGAKGVAMAAAYAAGFFTTFEDSVKSMRSEVQVFIPDSTRHAALTKRFARYRHVSDWINHFPPK
ncbi:FGGY-family carbohydrate kinase [Vibrio penaeicida]|uniref:FGGY-family carbohydrate kinase n=1 Tax=Vibrio penaeicida TaxID=104609 RepID=UPI0027358C9D|nr:FGGY-family carbohydrate kinase [Vibrio penaeicida]MDP2572650.1 FGGY-family carbohydrate kinase [Vibrio penaeicida]